MNPQQLVAFDAHYKASRDALVAMQTASLKGLDPDTARTRQTAFTAVLDARDKANADARAALATLPDAPAASTVPVPSILDAIAKAPAPTVPGMPTAGPGVPLGVPIGGGAVTLAPGGVAPPAPVAQHTASAIAGLAEPGTGALEMGADGVVRVRGRAAAAPAPAGAFAEKLA
jgi:hypothetical protein